jgi:hypothetical protein
LIQDEGFKQLLRENRFPWFRTTSSRIRHVTFYPPSRLQNSQRFMKPTIRIGAIRLAKLVDDGMIEKPNGWQIPRQDFHSHKVK